MGKPPNDDGDDDDAADDDVSVFSLRLKMICFFCLSLITLPPYVPTQGAFPRQRFTPPKQPSRPTVHFSEMALRITCTYERGKCETKGRSGTNKWSSLHVPKHRTTTGLTRKIRPLMDNFINSIKSLCCSEQVTGRSAGNDRTGNLTSAHVFVGAFAHCRSFEP